MKRLISPTGITFLVLMLYLGSILARSGGDPLAFVRIGERYQVEGAVDAEGYDGQFVYFIARDPTPETVASFLDVPAYRYQRILLPLLGRALSFGQEALLPWGLLLIGVASHLAGVGLVARLLENLGANRWFALVYGLYAGLLLGVRLILPEPLALMLVALAFLAGRKQRPVLQWAAFGLAVFAKETMLLFVAGQFLSELLRRNGRAAAGLIAFAVLPYAGFQFWLSRVFGEVGLASGGAMATAFEAVPFMGLIRIGSYSGWLLLAFAIVTVPFFYVPAVWGVLRGLREILRGRGGPLACSLLCNAVVLPFLPFSTVREPGGLFRFGAGLVLAVLLFGADRGERKVLRTSMLWLALSAILIRS